jgi:hypothetical protein
LLLLSAPLLPVFHVFDVVSGALLVSPAVSGIMQQL